MAISGIAFFLWLWLFFSSFYIFILLALHKLSTTWRSFCNYSIIRSVSWKRKEVTMLCDWTATWVVGGCYLPSIISFHILSVKVWASTEQWRLRGHHRTQTALCFLLSPLLSLLPFDCCLLCREQRMEWAGCEEDRDRKIIGVFHVSENRGNWWFSGQMKGYLKSKSYYSGALGRIS